MLEVFNYLGVTMLTERGGVLIDPVDSIKCRKQTMKEPPEEGGLVRVKTFKSC